MDLDDNLERLRKRHTWNEKYVDRLSNDFLIFEKNMAQAFQREQMMNNNMEKQMQWPSEYRTYQIAISTSYESYVVCHKSTKKWTI